MIIINKVSYNNSDFINFCYKLEHEHINVIKEQRSPKGNCLNNLEEFKSVFIAYISNKAVGCLAMKDIIDNKIELGRLYVLPEYRNKGVATELFKSVEKYAVDNKVNKLVLDTYKRFSSAIRLYKKLGFYEIDNYIEDSPYSICMEKTLVLS